MFSFTLASGWTQYGSSWFGKQCDEGYFTSTEKIYMKVGIIITFYSFLLNSAVPFHITVAMPGGRVITSWVSADWCLSIWNTIVLSITWGFHLIFSAVRIIVTKEGGGISGLQICAYSFFFLQISGISYIWIKMHTLVYMFKWILHLLLGSLFHFLGHSIHTMIKRSKFPINHKPLTLQSCLIFCYCWYF